MIEGTLPVRTDQAELVLRFLLPQLASEQAITTKILSAVPAGQESYRPNEKARSAFGLAWHIAAVEMWFLDAVVHREFRDIAGKPPDVKTCSDVARWYARSAADRAPLLSALSGEALVEPVDFIGLRNDPAVAYLNIAIRHSVHHRGQLSAYLRCMGARVPAVYVESADEPYPPNPESEQATIEVPPAF